MNVYFYLMLVLGLLIATAMSVVLIGLVRRQLMEGELHKHQPRRW